MEKRTLIDGLIIDGDTIEVLLRGNDLDACTAKNITLCRARECNPDAIPTAWIYYVDTDGDPVYVGCIDDDGTIYAMDDSNPYSDEPTWRLALRDFGFAGETESGARDFLLSF